MAVYPNSIPTLVTVTGSHHPQSEHINIPYRELEAIAQELGKNPKTITEVVPLQTPATVAAVLDMFAYILKNLANAANWYSGAIPSRGLLSGHGGLATIAPGATNYLEFFGRGLSASRDPTRLYLPFACKLSNLRVQAATGQPGSGNLLFTIEKNGVSTGVTFDFPAGFGGGSIAATDTDVSFAAGDYLTVSALNNAAAASAQIGTFAGEIYQTG